MLRRTLVCSFFVTLPAWAVGCAQQPGTEPVTGLLTFGDPTTGGVTTNSPTTISPMTAGAEAGSTGTGQAPGDSTTAGVVATDTAAVDGTTGVGEGTTGLPGTTGAGSSSDGGVSSSDGAMQMPVSLCAAPNSAIGPNGGTVTLDTINVDVFNGALGDLNVVVQAAHTFVADLTVTITHLPSGTTAQLLLGACGGNDDIDATFDDAAAAIPACSAVAPTVSGVVLPFASLAGFNGLGDATGGWQLSITDGVDQDGGTLASWCVELAP